MPVKKYYETLYESFLLQAQSEKENLEHLRFIISYKASILDKTDSQEVEKFNELLTEYRNVYLGKTSETTVPRETLEIDFDKIDFSKLVIGKDEFDASLFR